MEVITPTQGLTRRVAHHYAEWRAAQGDKVWDRPQVLSWGVWCRREWYRIAWSVDPPCVLLNPSQQRYIWRCIIEDSQVGKALLSCTATVAVALRTYRTVREYRLNPGRESPLGIAGSNEDTAAFRQWFMAYEDWLVQHRAVDMDSLADRIVEAIQSHGVAVDRCLCHYGFVTLNPQQARLFEVLQAAGVSTKPRVSSARKARSWQLSCATPRHEIRAAARWARSLLSKEPNARIGILSMDLQAQRALLKRELGLILHPQSCARFREDESSPFSVSLGLPLADHGMVRDALNILQLAVDGLSPSRVSAVLLASWMSGSVEEQDMRARLDVKLRFQNRPFVKLGTLIHYSNDESSTACPILHQRLLRLYQKRSKTPKTQTIAKWIQTFSRWLHGVDWPTEGQLSSVAFQLFEAWQETLEECASLNDLAPAMDAHNALAYLGRSLQERSFQAETADAPVQLMGLAGSVGMGFDYIWWLGLHDQAWPEAARPDPFLTFPEQKAVRLHWATPRLQYEHALRCTRALQQACTGMVFSHALQDGERILRPSPLIADASALPEVDILAQERDYRHEIMDSRYCQEVLEQAVPWQRGKTTVSGGATLLQDQALCPFRAFSRHRLRARNPEDQDLTIVDHLMRGTIAHEVMENIWQQLGGREALGEADATGLSEDVNSVIQQVVTEVLEVWKKKQPTLFRGVFLRCETQRIEAMLRRFLEHEKQRPLFSVLNVEQRVEVEFAGLPLTLQVDRVDRLADGSRMILDYKTGKVDIKKWQGERPEEPQLPLYALIMEDMAEAPVSAVAFATLRRGEEGFTGLAKDADVLPGELASKALQSKDFTTQMREWRQVLSGLVRDFQAGHATLSPKSDDVCRRCDLHALCRIHDQCGAEVSTDR